MRGKNGLINIAFHNQPVSKDHLMRDLEYAVKYRFFYGEVIDQRIIVLDYNKKSIDKLQIMPDLEYNGKLYYIPEINGKSILNNIKDKVEKNKELSEYEQYIFSILPLTNHGYDDEEMLMEELCIITPKLNIPKENREAISLCQMVLLELYINDYYRKKELQDIITIPT